MLVQVPLLSLVTVFHYIDIWLNQSFEFERPYVCIISDNLQDSNNFPLLVPYRIPTQPYNHDGFRNTEIPELTLVGLRNWNVRGIIRQVNSENPAGNNQKYNCEGSFNSQTPFLFTKRNLLSRGEFSEGMSDLQDTTPQHQSQAWHR